MTTKTDDLKITLEEYQEVLRELSDQYRTLLNLSHRINILEEAVDAAPGGDSGIYTARANRYRQKLRETHAEFGARLP